jgi:hypothetical protein
MRGSFCGVVVLAAGLALPASAQVERCGTVIWPVRNPADTMNNPYTMKYMISSQRLQKDGTTKISESTILIARDSQGRWMNSMTVAPSPEEEDPSTHFCVYDTVAGIRTTWSVPGKQATQMKIAEIESSRSSCAKDKTPEADVSGSKPVVEDLGTMMIQGYLAQGFKTSRSISTPANGTDKTIVSSVEIWRAAVQGLNFLAGSELTYHDRFYDPWHWSKSEKLENFGQRPPEFFSTVLRRSGLLVREVIDDPRFGKGSEELQDFYLGEPTPDLFQPPEDYKIVTKKPPVIACPSEEAAAPTEPPPPPAK